MRWRASNDCLYQLSLTGAVARARRGPQMKTPEPSKENPSAQCIAQFTGTDNPRHLRVIVTLLQRPLPRKSLDSIASCSNGPELVAELRRRGLELPCERIQFIDCDGLHCRPGVYYLTETDRRKLRRWLAKRARGVTA